MHDQSPKSTTSFDAIVVVSPGHEGNDEKNQDRARYYARNQVAALSDGLSSSPYSEVAAQICVTDAPGLLVGNGNDCKKQLESLSQTLFAQRWAVQDEPVAIPTGVTPAMEPAFREAVRHQRANAFQATIVAIRLTAVPGRTHGQIISCGDSALYAFRPNGAVITTTRRWDCGGPAGPGESSTNSPCSRPPNGTEVLVKILGPLPRWPAVAKQFDILSRYQHHWLVCIPLDVASSIRGEAPVPDRSRLVQDAEHDPWLVPTYLLGCAPAVGSAQYRQIRYCRNIRHIPNRDQTRATKPDTSITPVLPDHVAAGRWAYADESFPADTHFVLASDGFYRGFVDETEMWIWLKQHEAVLQTSAEPLNELHNRLKSRLGDDDISLVWVRPTAFHAHFDGHIVARRSAGGSNRGS